MLCACHKSNSTMPVIQNVKKVQSADFHTHFLHEIMLNKIIYSSIWDYFSWEYSIHSFRMGPFLGHLFQIQKLHKYTIGQKALPPNFFPPFAFSPHSNPVAEQIKQIIIDILWREVYFSSSSPTEFMQTKNFKSSLISIVAALACLFVGMPFCLL